MNISSIWTGKINNIG